MQMPGNATPPHADRRHPAPGSPTAPRTSGSG